MFLSFESDYAIPEPDLELVAALALFLVYLFFFFFFDRRQFSWYFSCKKAESLL